MKNRLDTVVISIVQAIRNALEENGVTFEEYRAGTKYLLETAKANEIKLMIDLFFNTTICHIENQQFGGSTSTLEGPYFLTDAPFIDNGKLRLFEGDNGEPLVVRGRVTDQEGRPIAGAVIDIWHSTPDGKYAGFHGDMPRDCYRGKLRTGADGRYEVKTTVPVPYQVPHHGPVGALLDAMGRHSWRPAHVHYKVAMDGFHPLTTQAYFEGGDYVNDDCCEGVYPEQVFPDVREGGVRVVENNFQLAPSVRQGSHAEPAFAA